MEKTRLDVQQIMNVCWNEDIVSKEELFRKVVDDYEMSESRFETLLSKLVKKHYLFEKDGNYRAIIPREQFAYSFNLLDAFKDDANPNIMAPSDGNLCNGGGGGL